MPRALLCCLALMSVSACEETPSTPADRARAEDLPPRPRACGEKGCRSGLLLELDSPVSEQALTGAAVRYCRGDYCERASFPNPKRGRAGYGMSLVNAQGRPSSMVKVRRRNKGKPWLSFGPLAAPSLRDGDPYRVTITDPQGKVLLDVQHTVAAYEPIYANGPECGVTCQRAVLDLRVQPD